MAQITLTAGEVAFDGNPVFGNNTIFGTTTGSETVLVGGGRQVFGADFNAGGDTVILAGAANQYSISRSGSTIVITGPNGTEVRFPAPNPALTVAQQPSIVFNNGTAANTTDDVSFKLSTSTAGVVSLGATAITTTPTTVGGGAPNPTGQILNVTATDVDEGGTILYTFTLSQAPTAPVTISVVTTGGTATATSDYTVVSTTLTFAAGQTTQILPVQTIADNNPEGAETVAIQVTVPNGVTLAANADLVAVINAQAVPPQEFRLTTGNDTFTGGSADDRFVGAQITTEPGKLLSANDVLNGGGGNDTLELTNATNAGNNVATPNQLADIDFTNVTSIETLVTNYQVVQLGAQANKAGIATVDTATRTDAQNVANNFVALGTTLDLTSDANGDGVVDFNRALNVTMANSAADTVRLSLAAAAGSTINTGSTFTPTATAGNPNPVAFGAIDNIVLTGQTNPVRLTFTSSAVGNGSAFDAGTTTGAVAAQSEDGNDALVGGIVRFDDEGIRFSGGQFDVRDVSGVARGTFNEAVLGTALGETITANLPVGSTLGSYINAGGGNDTVNGSDNNDFLVGGAGDDTLNGGLGVDSILGGAGNDVIVGGPGTDALLDGGEGSDTYVYNDGEFVAAEVINDSGTGAGDVDYIALTSQSNITDALFAGRGGIEGLAINGQAVVGGILTNAGVITATIGANAQASGIRTVYASNDTLDASAYTSAADLTVYGQGNVTTGAGNDTIVLQNQTAQQTRLTSAPINHLTSSAALQSFIGTVIGGAGNDTVIAGYALTNGAVTATLTGGAGTDTLVLGGSVNGQGGVVPSGTNITYTLNFGASFTGFENININNTNVADAAVAYTLTVTDPNVAAGGTLTINGSALRGAVAVGGGVTGTEILTVDASLLTGTRAVVVTGGEANDVLTGGAGADTLNGGVGNDTLTGGAGLDTLNGGAGNDTFVYADGEFLAGETVVGGDGTDILQVASTTAITDAQFANKSTVETLNTNVTGATVQNDGTAEVNVGTLARQAGIVTVNAGNDDVSAAGYDANGLTINIGTGVGNTAGNVTGSAFNDVVVINPVADYAANGVIALGAGNDRLDAGFTIDNFALNAAATATFGGGDGQDELRIGGDALAAGFAAGSFNNSIFDFAATGNKFSGFETLTILATGVGTAAAPGAANDFTVRLGGANVLGTNAAGFFTINASALTGTIAGIAAPNNTQQLFLDAGTQASGPVTTALDVTGGSNNDVLITGNGADILRGGAGNDTLQGGAGFDTYLGGDGDDTIILSVTEFNNDNDSIDGGEGGESSVGDTLLIRGTQNLAAGGPVQEIADVGFGSRIVAGSIEQITLEGVLGGNTGFNYTAGFFSQSAGVNVINVGARANGTTVSIANYTTGGPLNFTTPSVTLNDTAVTTNNTTFLGSAFADTFNLGVTNTTLGGGNDVVRAANGDDTINFGRTLDGADIVDGGAGIDTLNVSGNGVVGTTDAQTFNLAATVAGGAVTSGIYAIDRLVLAAGVAFADNTAPTNDVAGSVSQYTVNVGASMFDSASSTLTIDGSALRSGVILTLAGGQSATTGDETLVVNASATGTTFATGPAVAGNGLTTVTNAIIVNGGAAADTIIGGSGADTLNGGAGNDRISGGAGADTIDGGAGNDELLGGDGNDVITAGAGIDRIVGGLGADTINLGNDGARDTVVFGFSTTGGVTTYDAPRADIQGIEQINGFGFDTDNVAGLNANADVLQFSYSQSQNGNVAGTAASIINENSTSITNGFVAPTSVLGDAVTKASTLLAAIQLIEQEFNSDPVANSGVVSFTYGGNTYIGLIEDTDPTAGITEAFTQIVQINGVQAGVNALIDGGAGVGIGLGIAI